MQKENENLKFYLLNFSLIRKIKKCLQPGSFRLFFLLHFISEYGGNARISITFKAQIMRIIYLVNAEKM